MAENLSPSPLASALLFLESKYRSDAALAADPLSIPKSFRDPFDQELTAWVAACLAYGRVAPMLRAIRKVIGALGEEPAVLIREEGEADLRRRLEVELDDWKWRFHKVQDVIEWILAWKRLDTETQWHGVEAHLLPSNGKSADQALSEMIRRMRRELPVSPGTRFSLPDPLEGAACKRWRMFLRWMVRSDWPDLGLWTRYPASSLIIPLDTHVARTAKRIGLCARKSPDGRMACEITDALRKLDGEDPLRFDFAISHLGILGDCAGRPGLYACEACPLKAFCQ